MYATSPVARELPMLTTSPECKTVHHVLAAAGLQTALASKPRLMALVVCARC